MESTPSCSSTSQKCTSCGGVEVSGWCVECVDALCEQCVLAHRRVKMTRCHTIKTQPSLGQPSSGGRYCPIHTSELLQLYCFTCYRMTCRDCQLMDHQNHRYQFVHEVLENQRKVLDQLVESVGQQRQTVTQSLMDMDARLQVIKENKFALRKKLQETFIVFCQQFKQRLFSLSNDVEIAYQTEMDGIENRKKYLMALEEKRQHVEQCIDNARNTEDLPTLLAYITQVNKLKELLSKDVSPPQSMIHLALLVNKAAFNTLGSFGKLVVSAIPFSCSQNRPQDPPSITAVQHQDTAVAHTSSCPAPPCKPLPQTGNAKYADSSNPVNYLSSQRTLSNQPCPPPSSRPSLCQLNTDGTTSTSVYPTSYDQSPPTSDAQMSLDLQTNPRQSASVLAIQTQPTVFPTNQTQPTVFPTNQTQPTVFPTNQTQPTVFPTNQTQPTVFPTNQTQPTVFPTNYTQPTVFPTNYTQPTVFPTNYTQPISTSACVQVCLPLNYSQSSVATASYSQSSVVPSTVHQPPLYPGQNSSPATSTGTLNQPSTVSVMQLAGYTAPLVLLQRAPAVPQQFSLLNQLLSEPVPGQYNQSAVEVVNQHSMYQGNPSHQTNMTLNHSQSSSQSQSDQQPPSMVSLCHLVSGVTVNQSRATSVQDQSRTAAITNYKQPTKDLVSNAKTAKIPVNQPSTNPTNQQNSDTVSPLLTKSEITIQNHPILVKYLFNLSKPSSSKKCPDGNLDLPPSDTNQPSAASLSASSPHCPPPSPTVKAVADSACDVSAPCVGDVSAATGHQAAENEPTSTVSESHIPEQVLSELSSLWDDINASISLDSDPDLMPSEGSSSEEPAVSPGPVLGETPQETGGTAGSHTEPGVKPSSGKLNCKAELMSCDEVASPVVEYPGTSARTRWLKQEPDAENQETKTDLANIPLGNPSGPYLAHEIQSMKTNCEELGSADEHPAYIWREWQPRVCLFRLPISTLRPGQPSPRFLLLPGDTKNEIHLQEIDDDDQSHADDIMDFLEPLSSPETPALLQAVTCAVCRCPNASVVCGPCGRGFHRDCHIPPTGPSLCSEWICSLCQDLDEPWDPYSTDRPKRRCLSLLDQRKCEHILLYLTCEISSDVWGSEVSCGSSHLSLIQERLSQQCSPPYRTPTEFISDVWVFFQTLSLSKENSEVLNHLQDSFHNKLLEIFGRELHPSLLQLHSVAHTEEVREAGPDYLPPCENNNQTETAGGAEESAVMTYTNTNQMERNLCVPGGAEPEASNSLVSNDGLTEVGGTEGSKVMWTPGGLVSEGRASLVEKDKLKETRKRLRQFLNCLPPAKKPTMSRKAEPPSY
ncbi:uncharacterized protein trim33l isoform 1-T1 [Polymixia lowei]